MSLFESKKEPCKNRYVLYFLQPLYFAYITSMLPLQCYPL